MIDEIEETLRLVHDPDYFLFFLARGAIHEAELAKAVEEYVIVKSGRQNPAACEARYLQTLREQADDLCKRYDSKIIMGHLKTLLGDRFEVYFGRN